MGWCNPAGCCRNLDVSMTTDELMKLADVYACNKALVGLGVGANKAASIDILAAVRSADEARSVLLSAMKNVVNGMKKCEAQL